MGFGACIMIFEKNLSEQVCWGCYEIEKKGAKVVCWQGEHWGGSLKSVRTAEVHPRTVGSVGGLKNSIFLAKAFEKQKKAFFALEGSLITRIQEVMKEWCPGDQQRLYSMIKPEYITGVVGTTLEILEVTSQSSTLQRAQRFHFDRHNARGVIVLTQTYRFSKHVRCHLRGRF
jgi:hypothetical protein